MTDEEIRKKCEEVWKTKHGWGLSYEDLIRCAYSHGAYGKGRTNGFDDKPGDVVYTSPEGHKMSRYQCTMWMHDWQSFYHGFTTAWKLAEKENKNA